MIRVVIRVIVLKRNMVISRKNITMIRTIMIETIKDKKMMIIEKMSIVKENLLMTGVVEVRVLSLTIIGNVIRNIIMVIIVIIVIMITKNHTIITTNKNTRV